ncbi:secreted protein [Christiangramia flava JLT2011]|nr:secreted protein [Christiangramia flava JLT2011]
MDDLQMNSVESLTFDQQLFVATFTYSFVNLFEVGDKETIPFANYTPPLLVKDILLLDQTFLI